MRQVLRRLRGRLSELGLGLALWDQDGQHLGSPEPAGEFCRLVCRPDGAWSREAGELAAQVVQGDQPAWRELSEGCCLLGAPLRKRRRTLGAAIACYPTSRWLDEEYLARRSGELGLDGQVLAAHARAVRLRDAADAPGLLNVLEWLLEDEQALHVANEELQTLSVNLSTTYEELSLLYGISGSMKVTQQPREFLFHVCRELLEVMNVSAAAAVLRAQPSAPREEVVLTGDIALRPDQLRLLADTHVGRRLARSDGPLVDNEFCWRTQPELGKTIRNLIAVPLAHEQPLGMLMALNKVDGDFDSVDLKLMGSIGSQAGVFLTNHILYADLQDLLMGVLHALTATIDAKDPYTCGHSNRVAILSRRLAEACGLPPPKVQQVYLAGLLHDIGKIGVPEATLRKPGRLTEEEFQPIRLHPAIGAKILEGIRQLEEVLPGILHHHEHPDGNGYPQGLRGSRIPQAARIIGLADGFDAMSSNRTYRKALPLAAVVDEIRRHTGTQFDREVVEKLLAMDLEALLEELRQPAEAVLPICLAQEKQP